MAIPTKKKLKIPKAVIGVGNSEADWQTQDDFRTLCRAKEIEADPKRSANVKVYAKQQMMDAACIACEDE